MEVRFIVDRVFGACLALALVALVVALLAFLLATFVVQLLKRSPRARKILRACADHYEREAAAAATTQALQLGELPSPSGGPGGGGGAAECDCLEAPSSLGTQQSLQRLGSSRAFIQARNAMRNACSSSAKSSLICLGITLLLSVVHLALMMHFGSNLTSRAAQADSWNPADIAPPDFPRQMGCGKCNSGAKTDAQIEACVEPCFSLAYVKEWEAFAKSHEWRLVYFPSRAGEGQSSANISAWWLPADPARVAEGEIPPRIVVMHGLASNNNHCGVQATCFLLRTMGFSCLTPSVRDYGLSGQSAHPGAATWGYDYHLDVLGAWDYAREDPQGVLGGALPEAQVGIMGFSRGAMDAANAFGLEPRVQVAWIDSAPFTGLYGMVDASVRPYAGFLTPLLRGPVFWAAGFFGGVPVDKYVPLEVLTHCRPPRRRLMLSQGLLDGFVPITEGAAAAFFTSGLAECYDVSVYSPPSMCFGDGHHTYMWAFPDDARVELCDFWSKAFHRDPARCGLAALPRLQGDRTAEEALPPVPRYSQQLL